MININGYISLDYYIELNFEENGLKMVYGEVTSKSVEAEI